jgi:hypothetical protein
MTESGQQPRKSFALTTYTNYADIHFVSSVIR